MEVVLVVVVVEVVVALGTYCAYNNILYSEGQVCLVQMTVGIKVRLGLIVQIMVSIKHRKVRSD